MRKNFNLFGLLLVLLIGLWVAWPLLTPGFIPTHDGEYHLIRFWQFDKNIRSGNFLPRWAPDLNLGLGSPIFNFFYPWPNWVGEFFHSLGFSFIASFKLVLASGLVLSGLFFFLWAREAWGSWAGLVGAVFYLLTPYHLLDVYVRGSPGEVWALVFFPAVLWGTESFARNKKKIFLPVVSFFLALLILSHNVLALAFLPFLLSYLFFLILKKRLPLVREYVFFISLGLGLTAFFWLPALLEAKFVTGLKMINFADHFPAFSQLIVPSWGTGFSVTGIGDQLSFQLGLPHLLVAALVLFEFFRKKREPQLVFFLTWFLVLFFLLLEVSLPVWRVSPFLDYFQYPWRLLGLMALVTSGMAAFSGKRKLMSLILIGLALLFYTSYARPIKYASRNDSFYLENPNWTQGTATLGNSFETVWAVDEAKIPQESLEFTQDNCRSKELLRKPTFYRFEVDCASSDRVLARLAYFPGWTVLVNQKEAESQPENGLVSFNLLAGSSLVEIELRETPVRRLANLISFSSLLFLLGSAILTKKKDD